MLTDWKGHARTINLSVGRNRVCVGVVSTPVCCVPEWSHGPGETQPRVVYSVLERGARKQNVLEGGACYSVVVFCGLALLRRRGEGD